jgi:hypothetical protein
MDMNNSILNRLGAVLLLLLPLVIAGCFSSDDDEAPQPQPEPGSLNVTGTVTLDDGTPIEGATIRINPAAPAQVAAIRAQQLPKSIDKKGAKQGAYQPVLEAADAAIEPLATSAELVTDAQGNFTAEIEIDPDQTQILVEVSYAQAGLPTIDSARWADIEGDTLAIGTIVLPNLTGTEVTLQNGTGATTDDSVRIEGLPPEIDRFFARSYDPDADPDAFPGDFTEMGDIPLNSSVFAWAEALDADGNPVDQLSQAATMRMRIPQTQWQDLEDINDGTDRIEVPIYTFNEESSMWEQQAEVGWLEDSVGTLLPEDAQPLILDGSYPDNLYATFPINHLSWMNVDYAYIGPWTLSRLGITNRNNDCFYQAVTLARTIALSERGREVFAQFNKEGADLGEELADGQGPEIKSEAMEGANGHFKGNEEGDRDDQLYLANALWDGCGDGATDEQKKNTVLLIASTLLHETAHWKWDVKHDDGNWRNREPGGEAGNQLENDLFGGDVDPDPADPTGLPVRNGVKMTAEQRDQILNTANWPAPANGNAQPQSLAAMQTEESPLALTLTLDKASYDLGEEILASLEYTNEGDTTVSVLNTAYLEGYPISFEITRDGADTRVPFRGSRIDRQIDWQNDFVDLAPGEAITKQFPLLRDPDSGAVRYNLINSGQYSIQAFYSPHYGIAEAISAVVDFEVMPGGSLAGQLVDAATGDPLVGATVEIRSGDALLATAISDASGDYQVPELPAGSYDFVAKASGFLRATGQVTIVTGEQTVRNLSLSSLLAAGELRLVLTWGEYPEDLDSHLWLPANVPYHLYYSREGDVDGEVDECPYANLDVDDTDSYGPETITITQTFEGQYTYAIHNYDESPAITGSGAKVEVFDSSGLIQELTIPTQGDGLWWHVLTFERQPSGAINIDIIDQIGGDPAPYGDTDMGCQEGGVVVDEVVAE